MAGKNSYIIENENISVDISILHEVAGNDKNFIDKTVNTFLKNMPHTLYKIEESANNRDWDNLYIFSHSAKSSLSVIKADKMLDWMIQLENNAKNKVNLESIPGLIKKIKEKYLFAEEILKQRFKAKNDIL